MLNELEFGEFGNREEQITAITIYKDNQSSIELAKNPVHYTYTKHIDIQQHFIHKKVESREIELAYTN